MIIVNLMSMQKRFLEQLESLGCRGKRILVAVSGGLDSVVLLDLLIKSRYTIAVAHANFQLRGVESDGDETFVKQLALSSKIPVYVQSFDTNNYAIEKGVSIQMAARDLRYAWFFDVLDREKFDLVATAHHLNDNLETSLINFVRGTGLQGFLGISKKNERIVRPLLIFHRKEIEAYARQRDLSWREDSSNAGDEYQRNFIRHQVVPRLKEINPTLEETYAQTIHRLYAAQELADLGLEGLKQKYVSERESQVRILKSLLKERRHPSGILWELIKDYGFNLVQCEEIVRASSGQPGKVFLAPRVQLIIDRETLIISEYPEAWTEIGIEETQLEATLGAWSLSIGEHPDTGTINADPFTALLDKEKLTFPLKWRSWKEGDSFHPLGMDHRKKISDFLIDMKISGKDKGAVTVLESGGVVAWVVGYRIDDRFKITRETKSLIAFKVTMNL